MNLKVAALCENAVSVCSQANVACRLRKNLAEQITGYPKGSKFVGRFFTDKLDTLAGLGDLDGDFGKCRFHHFNVYQHSMAALLLFERYAENAAIHDRCLLDDAEYCKLTRLLESYVNSGVYTVKELIGIALVYHDVGKKAANTVTIDKLKKILRDCPGGEAILNTICSQIICELQLQGFIDENNALYEIANRDVRLNLNLSWISNEPFRNNVQRYITAILPQIGGMNHDHVELSARFFRSVCNRFGFSDEEIRFIEDIIRKHHDYTLSPEKITDHTLMSICEECKENPYKQVLYVSHFLVAQCDLGACLGEMNVSLYSHHETLIRERALITILKAILSTSSFSV